MGWWVVACLVTVVVAVLVAVLYPAAFLGAVAIAMMLALLYRAGVWRTMVSVSVAASVIRSSTFAAALPEAGWYAVQFGPLIIALIVTMRAPRRQMRQADRAVHTMLAAFVAIAIVSSMLGRAASDSLPQAALLCFVVMFLAATYSRRWTDAATVAGDMATLFWTIIALQAFGLLGAAVATWAFDPDYGRYVGLFSNANYAGIVAAMGIAIGIYLLRARRTRPLVTAALAVLGTTLAMSGSRGALLAAAVGLLVLILGRASRRTALRLSALGIAGAAVMLVANPLLAAQVQRFFIRDAATDISSGRLDLYAGLLRQFQGAPILGTGYRTSELTGGLAAHNIYLSVLVETGVIGAAVFVALILAIVAASRYGGAHRPLVAAAAAVAAMELTESSIFGFGGPTALPAWLIVLAFAAGGMHLRAASVERADDLHRPNADESPRALRARETRA